MKPEIHSLAKNERLSSKKEIAELFSQNTAFTAYPFKLLFRENSHDQAIGAALLCVVPKKNIKTAVGRNRIKRLIREVWRVNKHDVNRVLTKKNKQINVAVIFLAHKQVDFTTAEQKINTLLKRLQNTLEEKTDDEKNKN